MEDFKFVKMDKLEKNYDNMEEYVDKNTELICPCCSNKRRDEFQKTFNKNEIKIGDHLKVKIEGLSECGAECIEHMWVWVQYVGYNKGEVEEVKGRLDSLPLWIDNIREGDNIYVDLDQVEAHIKGPPHG